MVRIHELKRKARADYKKIKSVTCPALGETVYFTSEGFNHLIYAAHNRPRNINEQYLKLKCLEHAPAVIQGATQIKQARRVRLKKKGKWKKAVQYGLVREVKRGRKIRVIVEKVGENGKHRFVSVMPDDKTSHRRSRNTKKRPGGR
jgi:hypothetical protein